MKSAAFNLAFKVHRGEMDFNQGLLKSNEEGASEDYLDALNSLAGEIKHDKEQLQEMLSTAVTGPATGAEGETAASPEKAQKEIEQLKKDIDTHEKKRKNLQDGLETLHSVIQTPDNFVIPGINSFLILLVIGMITVLMMIWGQALLAVLVLIIGLGGAGALLFKDLKQLADQQAESQRRKDRTQGEIDTVEKSIADFTETINEKTAKLHDLLAHQGPTQEPPPEPPVADDTIAPIVPND